MTKVQKNPPEIQDSCNLLQVITCPLKNNCKKLLSLLPGNTHIVPSPTPYITTFFPRLL